MNKTGLQPVSRPMELVHYFGGWVECPSKQTDRTDGGWVQSTFGAKAEETPVKTAGNRICYKACVPLVTRQVYNLFQ